MPYNFAADSFHAKKLCSRLSSSEVHFLMKIGRFAFLRPPLGDLGATYDDHLRLIGKRLVDFLLALMKLFFARCYGWGATSDYWLKIGDFVPTGAGWPKISGRRVRPPTTILLLRKVGLSFICSFIWYINLDRSFYRFVTIHACDRRTDRQTDGQTEFSSQYRVCITCSAVKMNTQIDHSRRCNSHGWARTAGRMVTWRVI